MSLSTLIELGATTVKIARPSLYGLLIAAVLAGCASQERQLPTLEIALQSKERAQSDTD